VEENWKAQLLATIYLGQIVALAEMQGVASNAFEKTWYRNSELQSQAAEHDTNLLPASLGTNCPLLTLNRTVVTVKQNKQILDNVAAPPFSLVF